MTVETSFNGRRFRAEPDAGRPGAMTIVIHARFLSPDAYVTFVIGMAYYYNFRISSPVVFHRSGRYEGTYTCGITCDGKTSRFLYEYGSMNVHQSKKATDMSIKKMREEYKERFGTDAALDPEFRRRYWYTDWFHGDTHEFEDFDKARKAAEQDSGTQVYVYTTDMYTTFPKIAAIVKGKNSKIP